MTNFYEVLGLEECLSPEPSDIESAWEALTRESSTTKDGSSELHEARQVLSEPIARLEHWLKLRQIEPARGASMEPDFLDLFSQIHEALEKADSVYQRHEDATTALGKALLSKEAISAQLAVQECLGVVHQKKNARVERFPEFETAAEKGDYTEALAALGQLKFLKKWEHQCQERLLQLIEC